MQAVAARTGAFAPRVRGREPPDRRDAHARRPERVRLRRSARRASSCCCSTRRGRHAGAGRSTSAARAGRTGPYWHAFVPGIVAGQAYGFRAHGPSAPERGLRFDGDAVLLDPYGRGRRRARRLPPRGAARRSVDEERRRGRRVVRLGGRPAAGPPVRRDVIYEAHVKGFTAHPSSGVDAGAPRDLRRVHRADPVPRRPRDHGGRAAARVRVRRPGRARRPPELLGLPARLVLRAPRRVREPAGRAGRGRRVPRPRQGAPSRGPRGHPRRRLQPHGRGRRRRADVLLSRASPTSSTTSSTDDDPSRYADYTGTGNTLNANEPIVRRHDPRQPPRPGSRDMHVDGFRFDLASVLSRDEDGSPVPRPPIIWDIETDPVLAGTKLIAEAWDAAGLYQVGSFAGDRWIEWNGRFRDDVRSFVKSDPGKAWAVAPAHPGSPDIYAHLGPRAPEDHQLRDLPRRVHAQRRGLVRPQAQRGERRGQPRRQRRQPVAGTAASRGRPTTRRSRRSATRQVRNLLALELLSVGVPMLHDGRRGAADAARQQQRLLPGQRAVVVRLGPGRARRRPAALHRRADRRRGARRRRCSTRPSDVTLAELLERARGSS